MSFNRISFGPLAAPQPFSPAPSVPSLVSTGLQINQTPPAATTDPLAANIPQSANQVHVQAGKRMAAVNMAGTVSERGTTRINMANVSNGETGLLATANRGGTPKNASELRPDDLVEIEGYSTTVANAERLGYLTRDKTTGTYKDNSATLAAAEEAQKAEAEQKAAEEANDPHYGQPLTTEGATEALRELVHSTTAGSQVRALLNVIDHGEVGHNALAALASEMGNGVEPEAVGAKVATVIEGFRQQAVSLAQSHGADAEDFFAWAREHQAGAIKQAMLQHGQARSTAAYVPLVKAYMENLDKRNPDAIINARFPDAGVSAYKNQAGEVVLRTPNGEVSWRVAVRTGLVKPFRS